MEERKRRIVVVVLVVLLGVVMAVVVIVGLTRTSAEAPSPDQRGRTATVALSS